MGTREAWINSKPDKRVSSLLLSVPARDLLRGGSGPPTGDRSRNAVPDNGHNLLSPSFGLLPHHIPDQEVPYPEPVHRDNVRLDLLLRCGLRWWFYGVVGRVERGSDNIHGFPLRNRVVSCRCGVIDAFPK